MRPARALTLSALLSLVGLGLAAYLYYLHLGLLKGELLGGAACGTGLFNCHAVTSSRWGSLFGVPLSLWGMLGYLATLNASVIAWVVPEVQAAALALLALLSLLFVLSDLALLSIMVWQIGHLCPLCIGTYVSNLLMLLIAFTALPGGPGAALRQMAGAAGAWLPARQRPATWLFWTLLIVSGAAVAAVHASNAFLTQSDPVAVRQRLSEFMASGQRAVPDVTGDPVHGRADAPIALVEFSDFLCPVCQRASKFNTIILAGHRQDAKLIFKHYPLDGTCNDAVPRVVHPGACTLAAASECAHAQGKFWEFHDVIFAHEHDHGAGPHTSHGYPVAQVEADAERLGLDMTRFKACMASGEGLAAVKRDIEEGKKLQVNSTPTYVINGVKMSGIIPPATFDLMADTLKQAD